MLPYAPWLCWLVPMIGAVFTLVLTRVNSKLRNYAAVASIGLGVLFSFSVMTNVFAGNIFDWEISWTFVNLGVLVDPLSALTTSIISSIGLLVAVFSLEFMREDPSLTRYWFFLQLFVGGLCMVVMADNLLQLYVGWEIVGISCCTLVSFWYKDPNKARSGLKTFITLRVGDIFLLTSILIIYSYSGTFNFVALKQSTGWMLELSSSGLLLITALMLFGGAIAKSAQFPLHVWLPDAMPATPASFNAVTEVIAGIYLVARVLPMFHSALASGCLELTFFFSAIAWIGAFSALLGASMAMVQRNIVKVLAYSIISQYAYMMVGFGVGGLMVDPAAGYLAGNLHLMIDAVVSGLLFLCAAAIIYKVRSDDMFEMGGIRDRMPITFKCMVVGALATIGVPLLSGFWSEEAVYGAIWKLAQEAGRQGRFTLMFSAYGLYFLMMVTAAVTAFYVLRMMGIVFGQKRRHEEHKERFIKGVSPIMWVPMVIAASVVVVTGVLAPFIITGFHGFLSPLLNQSSIHGGPIDVLRNTFLSPGFGITCVVLAIGAYPAYQLYIKRRVDSINLTEKYPLLKNIHAFLWNRCYINALYYKVFVNGTKVLSQKIHRYIEVLTIDRANYVVARFFRRLSKATYKYSELGGIDALNYFIADIVASFSRRFRKIQTGVLSYNILMVCIGAALLIVLMFLFGGHIP